MGKTTRRDAIKMLASTAALVSCNKAASKLASKESAMTIIDTEPLGPFWKTLDPFLFCAHHDDNYPSGTKDLGPSDDLAGRNIGNDFTIKDGYRMYHGHTVPGFPSHPHRGFETVTIVRKGLLDHADSMGASARYGEGDVQWLTAGAGIQHSEMFPLLHQNAPNPFELFQVWLNLPAKNKMVSPHFTMMWNDKIPRYKTDKAEVCCIAGAHPNLKTPVLSPPPNSWASVDPHLAIWTIKLSKDGAFKIPSASANVNRRLYFFLGHSASIDGQEIASYHHVTLRADLEVKIEVGDDSEFLLLQGTAIGEPVAHRGPFVMNTMEELQQAFLDYRTTQFGGWPWKRSDPVHGGKLERFAKYANGKEERPV